MSQPIWDQCFSQLENSLSAQQFSTWIRPLQVVFIENDIRLLAPNQFVRDWVCEHFLTQIQTILDGLADNPPLVSIEIGSHIRKDTEDAGQNSRPDFNSSAVKPVQPKRSSTLNPNFTFESFVEGNSNQLARA
ncbi:MAG: chromosomal replication initiator protein DnaA, partial [Gammaproteobacteria bacterium]|nr:chromosomal replication initiator protein DnaA [Gammaproteobacteria bacterium]